MAVTKEFQKSHYPLPVYNYRVFIDDVAMSFTEVSGINIEHQTITYRHGYSYWEGEQITQFYYEKYQTVTMKKGTIKGINYLHDWLTNKESLMRMMQVSLCDEKGEPVVTWRLEKVIPVKLDAPTFSADSNDAAIESLEVLAARVSVEHHS